MASTRCGTTQALCELVSPAQAPSRLPTTASCKQPNIDIYRSAKPAATAPSSAYVQNHGLVAPGTSVGTLDITGNYTQFADGELRVELASATSYDRLEITGVAMLDGTLTVSLLDGFMPALGDSFGFLFASGGFGGQFASLSLPSLTPGLKWQLNPGARHAVSQRRCRAVGRLQPQRRRRRGRLHRVAEHARQRHSRCRRQQSGRRRGRLRPSGKRTLAKRPAVRAAARREPRPPKPAVPEPATLSLVLSRLCSLQVLCAAAGRARIRLGELSTMHLHFRRPNFVVIRREPCLKSRAANDLRFQPRQILFKESTP